VKRDEVGLAQLNPLDLSYVRSSLDVSISHTPLVSGWTAFDSRAHANACGKSAVTRAILSSLSSSDFA
jgi:hypothetical protein